MSDSNDAMADELEDLADAANPDLARALAEARAAPREQLTPLSEELRGYTLEPGGLVALNPDETLTVIPQDRSYEVIPVGSATLPTIKARYYDVTPKGHVRFWKSGSAIATFAAGQWIAVIDVTPEGEQGGVRIAVVGATPKDYGTYTNSTTTAGTSQGE